MAKITAIVATYLPTIDIVSVVARVEAMLDHSGNDYEIIVVDDGWNYAEFVSNKTTYVRTPEKGSGYPKAVNLAVSKASPDSDYLVVVHDDAEVEPETDLNHMLAQMQNQELVKLVSPKGIAPEGWLTTTYYSLNIPQWGGREITVELRGWYKEANSANVVSSVKAVPSGFWVIDRKAFEEVGGFNEEFSPGLGEDLDFCFKLRELGYVALYFPVVEYVHSTSTTLNRNYPELPDISNTHANLLNKIWNGKTAFVFEKGI